MLNGTTRDAQEVIAVMPPNMGEVTVEKAAINAVMAGCKPEYLPVVIAAIEQFAQMTLTFTVLWPRPWGPAQSWWSMVQFGTVSG